MPVIIKPNGDTGYSCGATAIDVSRAARMTIAAINNQPAVAGGVMREAEDDSRGGALVSALADLAGLLAWASVEEGDDGPNGRTRRAEALLRRVIANRFYGEAAGW